MLFIIGLWYDLYNCMIYIIRYSLQIFEKIKVIAGELVRTIFTSSGYLHYMLTSSLSTYHRVSHSRNHSASLPQPWCTVAQNARLGKPRSSLRLYFLFYTVIFPLGL